MKDVKSTDSTSNEELKVGQLYEWNGHELVPIQKSEQVKVPVTMEAMEAVRKTRARAPCVKLVVAPIDSTLGGRGQRIGSIRTSIQGHGGGAAVAA